MSNQLGANKAELQRHQYSIKEKKTLIQEFYDLPKSLQNKRKFSSSHNIAESTFKMWLKQYSPEDLNKPSEVQRFKDRKGIYPEVSAGLKEYIELRRRLFLVDGVGLSWDILRSRAFKIAEKVLDADRLSSFKASDGFIDKVLKSNGFVGVNLHGEGGEVKEEEAENAMRRFRVSLGDLMTKHDITADRVYNADQTGLFLPEIAKQNLLLCK
jgi:hypothetical protein